MVREGSWDLRVWVTEDGILPGLTSATRGWKVSRKQWVLVGS